MTFEFSGALFFWRGPSPWYFVAMPAQACEELKVVANRLTYGWGVIPVQVRIGGTSWQTSLIPKDGRYLVPVRADIRKAEALAEGDLVTVQVQTAE